MLTYSTEIPLPTGARQADLDVQRLMLGIEDCSEKSICVIGQTPDQLTLNRVKRFGRVIKENTEQFSGYICAAVRDYEPPPVTEQSLGRCITEIRSTNTAKELNDNEVYNFYMLGSDLDRVLADLRVPWCKRKESEQVVTLLDKKVALIVHGALGNGKTVVAHEAANIARRKGVPTYIATEANQWTDNDIGIVASSGKDCILIIEDYPNRMDLVSLVTKRKLANVHLLLTARSTANDLAMDQLSTLVDLSDVAEISCDLLSAKEVQSFCEIFDRYGLWGQQYSLGSERKQEFLSKKLRGQVHAILLYALESPQMLDRMSLIVTRIQQKKQHFELFVIACIVSFIQGDRKLRTFALIAGDEFLPASLSADPLIGQFFNFSSGELRIHSSTMAEFVLKRICDPDEIVRVLVCIMERAETTRKISDDVYYIYRTLMQFAYVEKMLRTEGKLPAIIRYYELLKNIGDVKWNKHFWLQYAIACTTLGQLDRAGTYFETAKSLAKDDHVALAQINNHFARYLLEVAINSDVGDRFFSMFQSAREIVNLQLRLRKGDVKLKHFPFRIACNYAPFVDAYKKEFSQPQLVEIRRAIEFVKNRIDELTPDEYSNRDIQRCDELMKYAAMEIEGAMKT